MRPYQDLRRRGGSDHSEAAICFGRRTGRGQWNFTDPRQEGFERKSESCDSSSQRTENQGGVLSPA